LSVEEKSRQRIIYGEIRQEQRKSLIFSDMNRLTFWEKVRFWLKKVIAGGRDEDVFIRFRLDQTKDRVRATNTDMVDFDGRVFLPGLPEGLVKLARAAHRTASFFDTIWRNTESLRNVLDVMLSRRIPDAKRTLSDFCSTRELQEVFRTTESRNQLKKHILEQVSGYVESIPQSVMEEIEHGLKGLYLLKDVALYRYDELFVQFQSSLGAVVAGGEVTFHEAAPHRVLDLLDELYLALYSVSRLPGKLDMFSELFDYFFFVIAGGATDTTVEIPASSKTDEMRQSVTDLAEQAKIVRKTIPLVDIIRFFRNDPYYRFMAYLPHLKLRDFYYSNLKIKILEELDSRFNDIRMGVLGKIVQDVFPDGLLQFEYFHPEIQATLQRSGVGKLEVYRSLQIVHTFIRKVYRKGLLEFLRILGKIMPVRARQSGVDFTLLIAGIEDAEEKLREFDLSFSPDSEEGKTFHRYRHTGADRDPTQLAAYRALVNQKIWDARTIIEKFTYQMNGIAQSFTVILKGSHKQLNERYRSFESVSSADNSLDIRLRQYLNQIENTQKILNQIILIENET